MTRAQEVLAPGPRRTPYDVVRAAYAELWVTDLERSAQFYVGLLGFVVSDRTPDTLYLRGWEERVHHSLVLRERPLAACARVAFRVREEDDLDRIAEDFERRGCKATFVAGDRAGMGRALRVWDSFGFPLEFFHEIAVFETQLQRFDLQRGAPVLRLDHFNLHSPQLEECLGFWQELGFHCTEYISTDGDDERITGAWLTRKPAVHDVALTAGKGPRLHHLGFAVPDQIAVLRACDQLAAAGSAVSIERGPGRHGVSNAFFVYLRDPDGHRIELYACDYYTGDPAHEPIRWSVSDASCRSFWGTHAPDSWYDESTSVLDADGEIVPIMAATVDERTSRSEVMA
ncbi:MAG: 3,4-dihydroxyphenylacetate 2,3-dioxygenase [Gaiellales bacterium]